MTNYEFYKEELESVTLDEEAMCHFIRERILKTKTCTDRDCDRCTLCLPVWLLQEHKELEVDWEHVQRDTPILVKAKEDNEWKKRHFACFQQGEVYAYRNGCTSFSTDNAHVISYWDCAKLWKGSEEQAAEAR